ncbi:MAG: hypothetical protein MUP66_02400 [Candidatus Nanohaloarchaeota archaeon QJJ-5]|nr:hypothetical protein [Candidatus Nanohaloarchaeota archaeon QJJ-5]
MRFIGLRDADPETIVAETLALNEHQQEIYAALQGQELTVKDIVDTTGRSRSVVQRDLQEMLDTGIVMREGRTDRTVYYVYTALPFDRVKQKVAEILEDWHADVQDTLT